MIRNLLNQTIQVYPKTGLNAYGREVVGSATSYKARVEEVTKTRLLANGKVVTIDAVAVLAENPSVAINDKITFNSTTYKVFGKQVGLDAKGRTHHVQLELQRDAG